MNSCINFLQKAMNSLIFLLQRWICFSRLCYYSFLECVLPPGNSKPLVITAQENGLGLLSGNSFGCPQRKLDYCKHFFSVLCSFQQVLVSLPPLPLTTKVCVGRGGELLSHRPSRGERENESEQGSSVSSS